MTDAERRALLAAGFCCGALMKAAEGVEGMRAYPEYVDGIAQPVVVVEIPLLPTSRVRLQVTVEDV